MVGDSSNDALAARAAGCPVLLVPYGYSEGVDVQSVDCDGGGLNIAVGKDDKSVLVRLDRVRIWQNNKPDPEAGDDPGKLEDDEDGEPRASPSRSGGLGHVALLPAGLVFIALGLFQLAPGCIAHLEDPRFRKEGVVVQGTVMGKPTYSVSRSHAERQGDDVHDS